METGWEGCDLVQGGRQFGWSEPVTTWQHLLLQINTAGRLLDNPLDGVIQNMPERA